MRAILLLTWLMLSPAAAQTSRVDGVRIVERGIYEAESGPRDPATGVKSIRNARLLQATTSIPARLGLRFGLRYALQGSPIAGPATLEIVTRYPVPGIQRGTAPKLTEHRYSVRVGIGVPQYCDYQFDDAEELLPGIWIIEIWYAGRKLGGQRFCVNGAPEINAPACADELN